MAVTRKPDVIVTDLRMPRWEGRDLLECLLANNVTAAIPILVVSGYVSPDDHRRLERMGVAAVFNKPIEWPPLLKVIRELTRREAR
jgi:CheY-like chemotaxis protein